MTQTKTAGSIEAHQEAVSRVNAQVHTREEIKAELDTLFGGAPKARQAARILMEKLFVQTDGAETMAPLLTKEAVAKNVSEYFEKKAFLTEAQRRFPELLKVSGVSGPTPRPPVDLKKRPAASATTGPTPVQSILAGGSA